MMWTIAAILAASTLIGVVEIPALRKKRQRKEFMVFCSLLLLGSLLGIAQSLRVKLPNPLDLISLVFHPVSKVLYGLLE
ncbi:hypothetical protein ACFPES_10365 [Paenibacillus sp. GCM10023248]|uniref:hypothetical protein n=1 Tax=Bacillales TaxID=1385 RepID=UPI00237A0525|nr:MULTISPECIES: hypothetical protein [Bacillales]MDD9267426.1 hypothetical protein [Paenibacillus sp. MAHUQ-63]MDR6882641.1 hypothetical protein [Bacillus sp. 3255]